MPEKNLQPNECPNCGCPDFTQPVSGWKNLIFKEGDFQVTGSSTDRQFHHFPPFCDSCQKEIEQEESVKSGRIILLSAEKKSENPGVCPKCKDCSTFTRQFSGYCDYLWDEKKSSFVEVEKEDGECGLTCSRCGAMVNEEATKAEKKIVLYP